MILNSKSKSGGVKNGYGIGTGIEAGNGTRSGKGTGPEKRGTGGVITIRDALACQWVCESGVMNSDQLWRAVWGMTEDNLPSISSRYAHERVMFLARSGLLTGMRTSFSLKTYFKATKAAQDLAMSRGGGKLTPLASPPPNEIPHEHGLTELRLAVAQAGKAKLWTTDRLLAIDPKFPKERFTGGLCPDAIWVTQSGKRVAVEYERTRKGSGRVRNKVDSFTREMSRPDRLFDLVLWVAEPGAYQDLDQVVRTHQNQKLKTMDQLLRELKTTTPETSPETNNERGI